MVSPRVVAGAAAGVALRLTVPMVPSGLRRVKVWVGTWKVMRSPAFQKLEANSWEKSRA